MYNGKSIMHMHCCDVHDFERWIKSPQLLIENTLNARQIIMIKVNNNIV